MATAWEREDVVSIIAGVFDLNVKLDRIAHNVAAIRDLFEEGNDDEEEEAPEDD